MKVWIFEIQYKTQASSQGFVTVISELNTPKKRLQHVLRLIYFGSYLALFASTLTLAVLSVAYLLQEQGRFDKTVTVSVYCKPSIIAWEGEHPCNYEYYKGKHVKVERMQEYTKFSPALPVMAGISFGALVFLYITRYVFYGIGQISPFVQFRNLFRK